MKCLNFWKKKKSNKQVSVKPAEKTFEEPLQLSEEKKKRNGWFIVKRSEDNQFYFVYKAANGQIVAQSEMYKQKAGAYIGIASIIHNCESAEIVEE